MYKKWIPLLVIPIIFLSACNQSNQNLNTTEPTVQNVALSTHNVADIEHDLKRLDEVSNKYSTAMVNMQDIVNTALDNNDRKAFSVLYEQLEKDTHAFNAGLEAANFKSKEIKLVSDTFKSVHMLTLDLTKEKMKASPEQVRVDDIKQKIAALQRGVVIEIQRLQFVVYQASNPKKAEEQVNIKEAETTLTPESTTIAQATQPFSQNNIADIISDMNKLTSIFKKQEIELNHLNVKMKNALEQKNQNEMRAMLFEWQNSLQQLNEKYDAILLKSLEVSNLRSKYKKENDTRVRLVRVITSSNPDKNEFEKLQQELNSLSREIRQDVQYLQQKAS